MYILDAQRQTAFLATLAFVASHDDGWTKHLVSPDGVGWLLYYPNGESHGGGTRVLRVREVPASIAEWVTSCLGSTDEDDPRGLALDLTNDPETWFEVVATLETTSFDPAKVHAFVARLGVLQGINRRPVLGKRMAEIDSDAQAFAALAERARRLVA